MVCQHFGGGSGKKSCSGYTAGRDVKWEWARDLVNRILRMTLGGYFPIHVSVVHLVWCWWLSLCLCLSAGMWRSGGGDQYLPSPPQRWFTPPGLDLGRSPPKLHSRPDGMLLRRSVCRYSTSETSFYSCLYILTSCMHLLLLKTKKKKKKIQKTCI